MELTIEFDNKILKEIKKKLKSIDNTHTEWGWINEKTYPSGDIANRSNIKVAEIARINEFGGMSKSRVGGKQVRIPARPYFRQSLMITEQRALQDVTAIFKSILSNNDPSALLETQARLAAFDVIMSIRKQNMSPLAHKTVKIKGHSIQWIDTGVMMSNITFRVYKTKQSRAKGGNP